MFHVKPRSNMEPSSNGTQPDLEDPPVLDAPPEAPNPIDIAAMLTSDAVHFARLALEGGGTFSIDRRIALARAASEFARVMVERDKVLMTQQQLQIESARLQIEQQRWAAQGPKIELPNLRG
jgi:hypothetical protein